MEHRTSSGGSGTPPRVSPSRPVHYDRDPARGATDSRWATTDSAWLSSTSPVQPGSNSSSSNINSNSNSNSNRAGAHPHRAPSITDALAPPPSTAALLPPRTNARTLSQEMFFTSFFGAAFNGKLVGVYRIDVSVQEYAFLFLSFFHVWASFCDYATRFNADDYAHQGLWMLHGLGVLSLLSHLSDPQGFELSSAFLYGLLGLAYVRVLLTTTKPQCRPFVTGLAVINFTIMCFWLKNPLYPALAIAVHHADHDTAHHNEGLSPGTLGRSCDSMFPWLGCLGHPLGVVFLALTPKRYDLPMSIGHHTMKYTGLATMVFGGFACGVGTALENPADFNGGRFLYYAQSALGFALVLTLKRLYDRVSHVPVEQHAVRQSRPAAVLWVLVQPVLVGCVALAGASASLCIASTGLPLPPQRPDERVVAELRRGHLGGAFAAVLCVLALLRCCHGTANPDRITGWTVAMAALAAFVAPYTIETTWKFFSFLLLEAVAVMLLETTGTAHKVKR